MPSSRKADWLLLAALLTAAAMISLLVVLAAPPRRTGGMSCQRSTFFNSKDGMKAAYLALERLNYPVDRLRRPLDEDTLGDADALVLLEPLVPLAEYETDRLLDWVRGGGHLLLAPGGSASYSDDFDDDDDYGTTLADWFTWAEAPTFSYDKDEENDDAVSVRIEDTPNAEFLSGIAELTVAGVARLEETVVDANGPLADSPVTPLWGDEGGLLAARVVYGHGELIVLADVHALCNRGLREADNALWLANLARQLTVAERGGMLLFDEFHAGFPYQEPSWSAIGRLMLAEGWGSSVAQATLIAILALIAAGVRFGRPRGLGPARRRRHGEFLAAAGRLLHVARATGLAAETLRPHYRNRLCRALGLSQGVSDETLSAKLAARNCIWPFDAFTSGSARRLNVSKLLAACRQLEKVLEQLEHGK